jgi:hypothetical protein
MAFSGSISATTFNALKVVDHAFRRCRLPAQAITAEMQSYALESLYLLLSELANTKTPSWCIQRQIYPFYEGQPIVTLDNGTVEVLNANLRTLQELTGATVSLPTSYTVDFNDQDGGVGTVNTVGMKWTGASVDVTFQTSNDGLVWTTVETQNTIATAGEWTWTDIVPAMAKRLFRITSSSPMLLSEVYLGTLPQEIPMGSLNRDTYVAQSNKVFMGRPLTYWFQRDLPRPVMNLWPSPNLAAEHQQLIVWRHRHIMDTENLQQDVEVPQRWLEAITAGLASRVAAETPSVDPGLVGVLDQKWYAARQAAWDGDNDGSPTYINPGIGCYTK